MIAIHPLRQPTVATLLLVVALSSASAQTPQRVWSPPQSGTFWSAALTNYPPLPYLPFDVPVYSLPDGTFLFDDTTVDYSTLNMGSTTTLPPGPGEGGYGTNAPGDPCPCPYQYTSNEFHLEIHVNPSNPSFGNITIFGVQSTNYCLIEAKTNITDKTWFAWPGGLFPPTVPNGRVLGVGFDSSPTNMFFRAAQGYDTAQVIVEGSNEATEPSWDNAYARISANFLVSLQHTVVPDGQSLTLGYTISGTASNDTDYQLISGTVTIPGGGSSETIPVVPLADKLLEGDEIVTVTLYPTNGVIIDPDQASTNIVIHDNPFLQVAQLDSPVAVDYHPGTNALVVSYDENWNKQTNIYPNFRAIGTDWGPRPWSGVKGLIEEVKIATAKLTTNGFNAGELFFSTDLPGVIGKVSADGSAYNKNWITLSNATYTETNHIWGSLYVDQTGIWSNSLIAVAGEGAPMPPGLRGVWRVEGNGTFHLIATITNCIGLEGALTLPNDTNHYGPWAGKLITSDEYADVIYAVDPTGVYTAFPATNIVESGIQASDFDRVQDGQTLYCTLQEPGDTDQGWLLKVRQTSMSNVLDDIVITRAGELTQSNFPPPGTWASGKLFFLHWDNSQTNFVVRMVPVPWWNGQVSNTRIFEHSAFAPIDVPHQTP